MRTLLALSLLVLFSCSKEVAPPAEAAVSTPLDKKQVICDTLARTAKAAAEFRDLGVTQADFFQRATAQGDLPPAMVEAFREVIRIAYESKMTPEKTHLVIMEVCMS